MLNQISQDGRNKFSNGHVFLAHQFVEARRIQQVFPRHQNQFPSGTQRPHKIPGEHIEGKVGHLQMGMLGFPQPKHFFPPEVGIHQAAVRNHGALGFPGGAGGVNHVHQVIGFHVHGRIIVRFAGDFLPFGINGNDVTFKRRQVGPYLGAG